MAVRLGRIGPRFATFVRLAKVTELGQQYEALQQDLEAAYSRWNEATAELDALQVEVSGV